MDDGARDARLEAWFRAHADRVLVYLLHRTDPATAEDVLQEVFVIAFRKADSVPEPPIGWLLATARRVLANTVRGRRRRERLVHRLVEQVEQPHSGPSGDGDAGLARALDAMSPADREVLTLSAWYELSADDAATALGCSRGAYAVRLHRARKRLADLLAPVDDSLPETVTGAVPEAVHE